MTCIVGVASRGQVVIGGDSAGVQGSELSIRRDPKVFRKGPMVFGFTTSFRMGQLLQHAFTPPPLPKRGANLHRYLVADFVDALRVELKAKGWAQTKESQEIGGTFLIGVRGRLFRVCDDYQVAEAFDRCDAVGSGGDFALGALQATVAYAARYRVKVALAAAARYSPYVRAPFVLEGV